MSAETLTTGARWRSLIAVTSSALAVGLTLGMGIPLLSLTLEQRGVDATLNGLNAAMPAVAILGAGPFIPRMLAGLGPLRTMVAGIALSIATILLFPVFDDMAAWFVLRFLLGLGMALHWVTSETWISAMATEDTRGRVVGLYATMWGAGIALGPQILGLTGVNGLTPYLVGAVLLSLALVPLAFVRGLAPAIAGVSAGGLMRRVITAAPMLMATGLVCGFAETNALNLLPVYGVRNGYTAEGAVVLMSLFAAGGLMLQPLLGWLADRLDRRRLLLACALVGLGGALVMPLAAGSRISLWPLLFCWGGAISGFYTLGLTLIGQTFQGEDLSGANTALIMAYTSGMVIGPATGGIAMDLWNPHGFTIVLAVVCGAYYVLVMFLERRARIAQ